jgi:hypothetical protein
LSEDGLDFFINSTRKANRQSSFRKGGKAVANLILIVGLVIGGVSIFALRGGKVLYILLPALAVAAAVVQIAVVKTPVVETLLFYFLVFTVGVTGFYSFLGHAFNPDRVAKFIGWPPGNPFQWEVAVTNLSHTVLGFLCIWIRGAFWTATVIASSIWLLGCGYGHVREMVKNRNFAPGNAGAPFYSDVVKPLVLIALLIAYLSGA